MELQWDLEASLAIDGFLYYERTTSGIYSGAGTRLWVLFSTRLSRRKSVPKSDGDVLRDCCENGMHGDRNG